MTACFLLFTASLVFATPAGAGRNGVTPSAISIPAAVPAAASGNLVVFFSLPQDPVSGSTSGRLVAFFAPDRKGYAEMVLTDANGIEHCVAWRGARRSPCLVPDVHYSVTVEHQVSPVQASSIVIRDADGIVYAGATDIRPGATVLTRGLAGFRMYVDRVDGASDQPALYVSHGGGTVALTAGETARLGMYDVVSVSMPGSVSGNPGFLSWVIVRNRAGDDEESFAARDRR